MNSLLFYAGLGVGGLVILSILPGLRHLIKPVLESIWAVIQYIGAESGAWIIWLVKSIVRAHRDFVTHLTHSRKALDPTEGLDEEA